jgi:peptidoglycan/xylan/chitin deacetylase (PgdA/CDA1 family)
LSFAKIIARRIVFPLVLKLNLEKLFSFSATTNKLILVYHGVVQQPNHSVSVGPIAYTQFEEHLKYFKANFDIVSQEEIFHMYRTGFTPKRKTIAITFDDGYENNYSQAFPLLKKYNIPATMYIISKCIEDENIVTWYDAIDLIKHRLDIAKLREKSLKNTTVNSIDDLKSYIKRIDIKTRQDLFADIANQVNIDEVVKTTGREHWKLMNSHQVKELSNSGLIEIGAHSHNHPNLGEVSPEHAEMEVKTSKQLLEEVIGKEVKSIAFPDGSYTKQVKDICLAAGFKNLLAVDYRLPGDESDFNLLPRYCISSTTTFESNMVQVNRSFKNYGF